MSDLKVAESIANLIGGRLLISQLMNPKHLMGGENSLGIRLKKNNKNKINHIEITLNEGIYTVDFWSFSKDFCNNTKVATHAVSAEQLKEIIEKETNFVFPLGDHEENKRVAETILAQMGGRRAIECMVGIASYLPIQKGLQLIFKIKGEDGINGLEISHNSTDLYDVKFIKATGSKKTVVSESKNLYWDMLKTQIENTTGLSLIVPKVIFNH